MNKWCRSPTDGVSNNETLFNKKIMHNNNPEYIGYKKIIFYKN